MGERGVIPVLREPELVHRIDATIQRDREGWTSLGDPCRFAAPARDAERSRSACRTWLRSGPGSTVLVAATAAGELDPATSLAGAVERVARQRGCSL